MSKFLRRSWDRYSKLGKKRKKKQTWRRPKGRDNKMREKRRGYPVVVSLGYKKNKESKNKIRGKTPFLVNSLKDLDKIGKQEIAVIGHVGKKKKIEIIKKAKEKKILVCNVNVDKFLKENVKREKPKTQEKKK